MPRETNTGLGAVGAGQSGGAPLPPDIPFSTWARCLLAVGSAPALAGGAVPVRASDLPRTVVGGLRAAFIQSLRTFKLVTADGRAQPGLQDALRTPEGTQELVSRILTRRVGWAVARGTSPSQEELEDEFLARGVSEHDLDRVVKFYIDARRFAGMEVSPLWRGARGPKKRSASSARGGRPPVTPAVPKPEAPHPSTGASPADALTRAASRGLPPGTGAGPLAQYLVTGPPQDGVRASYDAAERSARETARWYLALAKALHMASEAAGSPRTS
jgi:hypothetical protein